MAETSKSDFVRRDNHGCPRTISWRRLRRVILSGETITGAIRRDALIWFLPTVFPESSDRESGFADRTNVVACDL